MAKKNVAKTITFTYEGKEYTLEYNRRTVRTMEQKGFEVDSLGSKPVTMIPILFWEAFQAHRKGTPLETTEEIWKHLNNRDELVDKLITMYVETVDSLIDDNEEDEGNVSWDPSW